MMLMTTPTTTTGTPRKWRLYAPEKTWTGRHTTEVRPEVTREIEADDSHEAARLFKRWTGRTAFKIWRIA